MPRREKVMRWVRCTTGLRTGEPREMPEEMALRLIDRGQAETITKAEVEAHLRFIGDEDDDRDELDVQVDYDTDDPPLITEVRTGPAEGDEPEGPEDDAGDEPEEEKTEAVPEEDLEPEAVDAIVSLEPGRSKKKKKHRRR